LSLINLNIDIAAPECLLPTFEYEWKFYITELLPAAGFALLFAIHVIYSAIKIVRDMGRAKMTSHVSKLISTFLIIMYFLYLSVTRRALDIFNCNPVSPSDGYLYTEFTSFKCDGGGLCRCDEEGGVQQSLVPAAIAFLLVYTLGFPLFCLIIIYFNKDRVVQDQYLRAHGIGDTRESNPEAYDLRKRYHLLYMYYTPNNVFWILVILARKFGVAFSALIFRGNPTFQLSIILLVLFSAFVLHVKFKPFLSDNQRYECIKNLERRAAEAVHSPIEFKKDYEMHKKVELAIRTAQESERKNKANKYKLQESKFWDNNRLKKSFMRRKKEKNIRNRAARFFFDYNTTEAILLASSIFVCLCGIMFESGGLDRESQIAERDAVTWAMIIVVVLTFIYIAVVFANELAPQLVVRVLQRFMRHNDNMTAEELDEGIILDKNPLLNVSALAASNAKSLGDQLEASLAQLENTETLNQQLAQNLEKLERQNSS